MASSSHRQPQWKPNPDAKGNNIPPCPRCVRKGPSFTTRYHPCKGVPCGPCRKRTRFRDGTGGLNAHQCRTGTGGTPPHKQKPHKPYHRKEEYVFRGVVYQKMTREEEMKMGMKEHPGVAMGYTEEEMEDVCEECGGWEWCHCRADEEKKEEEEEEEEGVVDDGLGSKRESDGWGGRRSRGDDSGRGGEGHAPSQDNMTAGYGNRGQSITSGNGWGGIVSRGGSGGRIPSQRQHMTTSDGWGGRVSPGYRGGSGIGRRPLSQGQHMAMGPGDVYRGQSLAVSDGWEGRLLHGGDGGIGRYAPSEGQNIALGNSDGGASGAPFQGQYMTSSDGYQYQHFQGQGWIRQYRY